MGASCLALRGVLRGFHVLQELSTSNASPRVAWLQQVGNWDQEKAVPQKIPFAVTLCHSCGQKRGDQKTLPSLPDFIWGIAGGPPGSMASSLCNWRRAHPLRGRGCSRVSAMSRYPKHAEQLLGLGGF